MLYQKMTAALCLLARVLTAQDQNELTSAFPDANYTVYKCENGGMLTKTPKPWGISLKRSAGKIEEIIVNRLNILEENFKPDLPSYPAYFHYDGNRLMALEGSLLYYKPENGHIKLLFVLCPPGKEAHGDGAPLQDKILAYQSETVKQQSTGREQIAKDKKFNEEKTKAASSLKGKQLKKLTVKILDGDTKNGIASQIHYGIEAELSDGKVLKTSNLGGFLPWEDLSIQFSGAQPGEEAVVVKEDASQIPNDEVVITVASKYHALNASARVSLLYNLPMEFSYNGKTSIHGLEGEHGKNGKNLTVRLKKDHTGKGNPVIKIEISETSGQVLQRLKISPDAALTLNANGDDGMSQRDFYKNAGNGGNGGDVQILRDAGTENYTIRIHNNAGYGGANKENSKRNGTNGRQGNISDQKGTVSLSW